jgi:hypothetical protein
VKVGRLYGGLRVIESGLSTKDKVVVVGLQRITTGAKVDPKLAEMPNRPGAVKVTASPTTPAGATEPAGAGKPASAGGPAGK